LATDTDQFTVQHCDTCGSTCVVLGQKNYAGAELTSHRQFEITDFTIVGIGQLDHQTRTVTIQRISANGTSVSQVTEDLDAPDNDAMIFFALDVGDEADTAIIVFVGWIVKALCGRHANVIRHK
jgi:hypothetical protein